MKRFLLVVLMVCFALSAQCQTVHYLSNAVLTWDAVTQLTDNSPVVGTLSYQIYRAVTPVTVRQDPALYILLGEAATPTFAITVPAGGPFAYAVRSKLVTDGGATTLYSTLSWSDVAGDSPSPFLYKLPSTLGPKPPKNLSGQ